MITLGKHYKEKYNLDKPNKYGKGCEKTESQKTKNGYSHLRMTNFISIYKTKIIENQDGTVIAKTTINCNYQAPYSHSSYFDRDGLEIIGSDNEEIQYYRKIRRGLK